MFYYEKSYYFHIFGNYKDKKETYKNCMHDLKLLKMRAYLSETLFMNKRNYYYIIYILNYIIHNFHLNMKFI